MFSMSVDPGCCILEFGLWVLCNVFRHKMSVIFFKSELHYEFDRPKTPWIILNIFIKKDYHFMIEIQKGPSAVIIALGISEQAMSFLFFLISDEGIASFSTLIVSTCSQLTHTMGRSCCASISSRCSSWDPVALEDGEPAIKQR